MHLSALVEMIESGFGDRTLLGSGDDAVTGERLAQLVRSGAVSLRGGSGVVYVGENHPLLPVVALAASWAGVPYVPVNYRLDDERLNQLVERQPDAIVLADERTLPRIRAGATLASWLESAADVTASAGDATLPPADDDEVAIVLYTSGTTSEPKSALLRHRHLMAYLLGSVEFGGADPSESTLVAVPPYHVAGVANMLSNLFAGRRLVYLGAFDPDVWLDTVRTEGVTHAMVVPTMLARIVDALEARGAVTADTPNLRSLSYGGAAVSERILRAAMHAFPHTDFVNAYGLTETASTIAVLGPDDHRAALDADDPDARRRLASAGRPLPGVEIEIRDDDGRALPAGDVGLIFVRGEQIAGEYATGSVLDDQGWFCTRDRGLVDAEGYLFIEGRADDTIIRGGENIAPAEIEAVLLTHPAVAQACVVGVPDDEWGQRMVAAVVTRPDHSITADELRDLVRSRLRGSKTPDAVVFRDALPHTDTGKLLRRVVLDELSASSEAAQ